MEKSRAAVIFERVEATLVRAGDLSPAPRKSFPKEHGNLLHEVRTGVQRDDFYFKSMSFVVFFSGFRASTVLSKAGRISHYFGKVEAAVELSQKDIEAILSDRQMIRNHKKVAACVGNAKVFLQIRKEYGSFGDMLLNFGHPDTISLSHLEELLAFLRRRFKYMGPATASHFLVDFGYPVIKPDRMVMRVLHRAGLVPDVTEAHYARAAEICRDISQELSVPIRYVDWVLVGLGMESRADICRLTAPRCTECLVGSECGYRPAGP